MHAKYHYLFWRPVTAIDPTSVEPAGDGFGPVPGFDDGNAGTVEQPGWRPLITTPNHPEYPAAHGSLTGAMSEVISRFLHTDWINVDVHGFDATGATGNLDAVQHFEKAADLRGQIIDARFWAGLHYHFSGEAGVTLGRQVADYDLKRAFQEIER
jgi:VCPO second helical-bundle domain